MNPSWRQGHDSDIYPTWKKSLAHERGKKLGYGMAEKLSLAMMLVCRACAPADRGLTYLLLINWFQIRPLIRKA